MENIPGRSKDDIDKFKEDALNPAIRRPIRISPLTNKEKIQTRKYYQEKFDGRSPDMAVIGESSKHTKTVKELINRFSADPALGMAFNLKRKDSLLEGFRLKGESSEFYQNFNNFLIEEIKQRDSRCRQNIKEFEQETEKLEQDFQAKKSELAKKRNSELDNAGELNIKARNAIWDDFYTDFDKIMKEYEEAIKSALGKATVKSLNSK